MAGQARIVLFTWVRTLGTMRLESPPLQPSTATIPPPWDRNQLAPPRVGSGLVGWRVIGANNREMGRGASPFWRVEEAYQAVHEAQLAFDQTVTRFYADAIGAWSWHILLGSEHVAVSSRVYRRQRECVYSAYQFRERFPTATVVTPHLLRPSPTSRGPLIPLPNSVPARPVPIVAGPTFEVTT